MKKLGNKSRRPARVQDLNRLCHQCDRHSKVLIVLDSKIVVVEEFCLDCDASYVGRFIQNAIRERFQFSLVLRDKDKKQKFKALLESARCALG